MNNEEMRLLKEKLDQVIVENRELIN